MYNVLRQINKGVSCILGLNEDPADTVRHVSIISVPNKSTTEHAKRTILAWMMTPESEYPTSLLPVSIGGCSAEDTIIVVSDQFNTDDIIAQCGMLGLGDKVMSRTSKQMEAPVILCDTAEMEEEPISKSELFRKLSSPKREVLNVREEDGEFIITYFQVRIRKTNTNDELLELLLGTRNLEVNVANGTVYALFDVSDLEQAASLILAAGIKPVFSKQLIPGTTKMNVVFRNKDEFSKPSTKLELVTHTTTLVSLIKRLIESNAIGSFVEVLIKGTALMIPGYAGNGCCFYFNDYFIAGKNGAYFQMLYNGNALTLDNINPEDEEGEAVLSQLRVVNDSLLLLLGQ